MYKKTQKIILCSLLTCSITCMEQATTYKLSGQDKAILLNRMPIEHTISKDPTGSFYKDYSFPNYSNPNNQFIIPYSVDYTVRLDAIPITAQPEHLDLEDEKKLEPCRLISFSNDGTQIAGASQNHILIWNASTGKIMRSIEYEKSIKICSIVYNPQSPSDLAVASTRPEGPTHLTIWNALNGLETKKVRLSTFQDEITQKPYSQNMVYNAAGTKLGIFLETKLPHIMIYNLAEETLNVIPIECKPGSSFNDLIYPITFLPDDSMIIFFFWLFNSEKGYLQFYDTKEGTLIKSINSRWYISTSFDDSGEIFAVSRYTTPNERIATELGTYSLSNLKKLYALVNTKLNHEMYSTLFAFAHDQKLTSKQIELLKDLGFDISSTTQSRCCIIS